jgi:enoyl-CoA hydratase/carnithine racemase
MPETISFEVEENGVATLTLNRPKRMNAFNATMAREVRQCWQVAREDDRIRAIVLRAAGDRAFCTGMDVGEGWTVNPENPFLKEDPGEWLGPKQHRVWKPVITAVQGLCAGGAFYFLNESDIIICSDNAEFFDPHVTFGLVAAVEPIGAIARMPYTEILRMSLLGSDERISAQTALRISLVTEVTTPDALWGRAAELAATIAAKPPVAVQGTVRALWEALDMPRSMAVSNALKYTQMGNPMSRVDRASAPRTTSWRTR